jgi:hypothetical protein
MFVVHLLKISTFGYSRKTYQQFRISLDRIIISNCSTIPFNNISIFPALIPLFMKKYYLILLLFTPLFSIAQSNFKKGYVINLKGDTSLGYINYKEWGQNPKSISFKTNLDDVSKQLDATNICGFAIDGFENYKRYILRASLAYVDMQRAPTGIDTTAKIDTVFLRVLQTGKNLTLFSLTDDIKTRFYITDNSRNVPEELIYRVYHDTEDDSHLIDNKRFIGQLNACAHHYRMDSPKLLKQTSRALYTEPDLIYIVSMINGNSEQVSEAATSNNIRLFVGASLNSNTLKYTGDVYWANKDKFSTSISPSLSFGFDGFVNPNIGKLFYRLEIGLAMNSYRVTGANYSPLEVSPSFYTENLKQFTVSFTPQLLYNFYNKESFKVFLGIGASINFSTYPNNQSIFTTNDYTGTTQTTTTSNFQSVRGLWLSPNAKLGIALNKQIEIYGTYFPPSVITDYTLLTGNVTSYQVGINYLLGKQKH